MTVKLHIKKDHKDIPDNYGMKVYFVDGSVVEFELAEHRFINKLQDLPLSVPYIEYLNKDDIYGQITLSSTLYIEFDKRFTKVVEINKEMKKK